MLPTLLAAPLCLLLAAAPAPAAAPAAEGPVLPLLSATAAFRGAGWGMTVDEVVKAFPGQARRLDPPQRLADGKSIEVAVEPLDIGGLAYRAHFLFEGGKLALVSLKTPAAKAATLADFDALKARLARETGTAGEDRPLDATFQYREVRFTAGATAVDVKFLQGALVLLYHPAEG